MSNLHTLDQDLLHEVLALCPDLTALYSLIRTHPNIYHAFLGRRRLLLKLTYRKQTKIRPRWRDLDTKDPEEFIKSIRHDLIAVVAFRESLWLAFEKHLHDKRTLEWAKELLVAYQRAELYSDGLSFAQETMARILSSGEVLERGVPDFARSVVRMYTITGRTIDAIELQELVRNRISPRSRDHGIWSDELIVSYKKLGLKERIIPVQLDNWNLYKLHKNPENDTTLIWARAAVLQYRDEGKDREALHFWQAVRSSLAPTSPQHTAWARYMMHMYARRKESSEILEIKGEVWQNISPDVNGYREWTAQLSEEYELAGRHDDAIAVCEAAWTATNERLSLRPDSTDWKYEVRGSGLLLANTYRRYGRTDDADVVEARCNEIR